MPWQIMDPCCNSLQLDLKNVDFDRNSCMNHSSPSKRSSMGLACFFPFFLGFLNALNEALCASVASASCTVRTLGDWALRTPSRDSVPGLLQSIDCCSTPSWIDADHSSLTAGSVESAAFETEDIGLLTASPKSSGGASAQLLCVIIASAIWTSRSLSASM